LRGRKWFLAQSLPSCCYGQVTWEASTFKSEEEIITKHNGKETHSRHHHIRNDDHHVGTRTLQTVYSNETATQCCGAVNPRTDVRSETARVVQKWMETATESRQATTVNVDTYFHIVTDTNGTKGNITDTDVANQLKILNDSFSPHGFTFTLLGTTRTANSTWYYGLNYSYLGTGYRSFDDSDMTDALRVGNASTLNVYFTAARGYFGYASFPWRYTRSPKKDGVVVQSGTIPGGDAVPKTEGKTLVHEVGHWLGLLHTFQIQNRRQAIPRPIPLFLSAFGSLLYPFGYRYGCLYNDDEISDTPRQSSSTSGCPSGLDSCIWRSGLDPIHNYMDCSDDVCLTEFTKGQVNRMHALWDKHRAA
jgi:Pregnancy-associated plasma protein-A